MAKTFQKNVVEIFAQYCGYVKNHRSVQFLLHLSKIPLNIKPPSPRQSRPFVPSLRLAVGREATCA